MIDALCAHVRSLPEMDAAALIPDDISVLIELFPVLRQVDVFVKAAQVRAAEFDDAQMRKRAGGALRELVRRMSARHQVIWFVDDLQWGDADSAALLFDVLPDRRRCFSWGRSVPTKPIPAHFFSPGSSFRSATIFRFPGPTCVSAR